MIPGNAQTSPGLTQMPRACEDDPNWESMRHFMKLDAPHLRGWFFSLQL